MIGITYAYIAYYTSQKEINVLESSCIKIEYKDLTEAIQLTEVYPINEEAGEKTKPYRFSIKNVCNVGVDYDIQLEVLEEANRMASKNIAIKVDNEAKELLTEEKKVNPIETEEYEAVEAYKVYRGKLDPKETKEHSIRIWLDESAGNESQNKVFHSKVAINAVQNQIAEINFSEYIMKQEGIEKIDHEETEQTPSLTDYRYTGASPNNYVYFGCEEECTEENLYRIIGVLPTQSTEGREYKNRVKLIKETSWSGNEVDNAESQYAPNNKGYMWDKSTQNKWENGSLQMTLNTEYWSNIKPYQKYIENTKWYLGGIDHTVQQTNSSKDFYKQERSNTKGYSGGETSFIGKIGLMYPSDYGYSLGLENEEQSIYPNRLNYINNSWIYSGENKYHEWTISPEVSNVTSKIAYAWYINFGGDLVPERVSATSMSLSVRPTFYLKEDVLYKNGEGSKEDPYRIRIEEQEKTDNFSNYIIAKSETESSIEIINHEETEQTPSLTDYRYVGANPNNYVYFGCEVNCTEENLYRVIGVIPTQSSENGEYENRVKLIKASNWKGKTASSSSQASNGYGYFWTTTDYTNKWENSSTKGVLNGEYYNELGEYKYYIGLAKWYLGAPLYSDNKNYTVKDFYTQERSNTQGYSKGEINYISNVGLMYPSDFGYSITGGNNGELWTSQAQYGNRVEYQYNSWLYNLENKYYEWTISPEKVYYSNAGAFAWYLNYEGYFVQAATHYSSYIYGIRPTFYLKEEVQYQSGDGSMENPYQIGL